jgi:hypothetical protein
LAKAERIIEKGLVKEGVPRGVIHRRGDGERRMYTDGMVVRRVSLGRVYFEWELARFAFGGRRLEIGVQMRGSDEQLEKM